MSDSSPHSEPPERPLHDYIDMEAYDVVAGQTYRDLLEQLKALQQSYDGCKHNVKALTTEADGLREQHEFLKRLQASDSERAYDLGNEAERLQRENTRLLEQLDSALDLLHRLREWDIIDGPGTPEGEFTADAPYWRGELDRVLSNPAKYPTLDDRNPASVVGVPWNEEGYAGEESTPASRSSVV